ncbi:MULTISPECIES: UDP-glucuronic acid decarboxylase family protein [unclassified Mesorhizobium]|uniref:UDP-glucuronic acid decarboxylase family protein n=1 Tax=unclassified Mesorhizobium TaxID=325217 RepID=UPI000BAEA31C|nr:MULTISPECIES: UDP-glucuronic acid decarboxylase family protein [unclassified Mesorhizobium]TGT61181.1 SDR family oxidoreductase [Mesorhizobium sp. M00.F.Ca.ET.170.01.1.1]AZO08947.1 SDR family oxidoreductase [Mesorhizobium sp. M3A.F.Ca.ET.080.04.2.1]PBB84187.1 NAD-dependent dehydratase [Mesorhizobium sp. WSM3876]RWB68175.1 MAG: SDR family oxidoreductase [Mesorhizobium sp.]RWB84582.1 MAG: SDR family oxidoreductase [Mesorhizobium sp.]
MSRVVKLNPGVNRRSAGRGRALVAGGAGFLGSHLCERLLRDGYEVVVLDNFHTGKRYNLSGIQRDPSFTCIKHDIVDALPMDLEVNEIYNLACPASPPHYQADPIHTFKTSVLGSINLLELARRNNAKIFQASTSEVYGDPLVHPQPEAYFGNVNTHGPRSCYDEGKRSAETLFFDYSRTYGIDVRVARIFNTYGPRMQPDDGRVVSNFIVQALRGEDITVYGSGQQTRSFCFVDDLIEGFIRLVNVPAAPQHPVNLGNPVEFTIMELAEMVIDYTNSRSRIVHRPLPIDDPRQRKPDISVARQHLGWEPKVALAEGLAHTTAYFDALLGSRQFVAARSRGRAAKEAVMS